MRRFPKFVVGMTMIALGAGPAFAADAPPFIPQAPLAAAPIATPAFDWSGVYYGTTGGYSLGPSVWSVYGQGGYNFTQGRMVFGIEARIGATDIGGGGAALLGTLSGKAGVLVNQRLLVYGTAGAGYFPSSSAFAWTAGAGVEVGLGDAVSLFGEARYVGFAGPGGNTIQINAGINWHLFR